jgi:hypothetical protein
MAILNIQLGEVGLVGVKPRVIYIDTNDTLATVTTAGYLNKAKQQGFAFAEYDMALVSTKTTPSSTVTQVAWLEVSYTSPNWSLVPTGSPGEVVLPTVANYIVHATNVTGTMATAAANVINAGNISAGLSGTAGTLSSFPATASKGSLIVAGVANTGNTNVTISNAAHGQASVVSIPDGGQATAEFIISDSAGTQHITSGGLQVDAGILSSGLAAGGFVGRVDAYPTTAAKGVLSLRAAVNATGDFDTIISNATAVGQDQVISIPDSGAATADFLLSTGAANILAQQEFVGINEVLTFGTGTWTTTRIAQGNYVKRHTPGDETSIIAVDITPAIRVAASKGFRLDSFDIIYAIAANALDAHSAVLDRIAYADNVAVSVTSVPITVTLATATQANPYVTNAVVDTPAFDITADSKYVLEITVDNAAASEYDYYGLMLRFSQTIA